MSFNVLTDESIEQAVRRIAREQIDNAIAEINDQSIGPHTVVHQVRKRCKKMRGLVRMVRPHFADSYKKENIWYRDSARRLSYIRDAQSNVEAFDNLMDHYKDEIDRETFAPIRQRLIERRKKLAEEGGTRQRLDDSLRRMREGRKRIAAWRLTESGFDAIAGGLIKTYKGGRAAMQKAYADPSARNFHAWRKRAKYHWYHARLLQPVWENPIKAWSNEAGLLSDYLGDDHDLTTLRETLANHPERFGSDQAIQAMIGLIAQRQVEMRTKAKPLGACIYAEEPESFISRLRRYWEASRSEAATEPQPLYNPQLMTG